MAVKLFTKYPHLLLSSIKEQIDKRTIRTWAYDGEGDFTHTAEQWDKQAWLRPKPQDDHLLLTIIAPKDKKLSDEVYAVYHGRFLEMAIRHVPNDFTHGVVNPR